MTHLKHHVYRVVMTSGKSHRFATQSPQLALGAVHLQHPNDFPFSVNGDVVMGRCCFCRAWVLKSDKYRAEPGRVYCEDC